jgi:DNA adenine methylase
VKASAENEAARPFLKWAGGKSQLIDKFQKFYPSGLKNETIHEYYEPFLGSGAVFFDIVNNYKIQSARLYDNNEELILTYKVVQQDVEELIGVLSKIEKQYLDLEQNERKSLYYKVREEFNHTSRKFNQDKYSKNLIHRAAQVIFLNKTCYNGLFRVNSKGSFNSPAGHYKNPTICDSVNLLKVSRILSKAEIIFGDYSKVLDDASAGAFIYFDPPYRPISNTSTFTSYSKHSFGDEQQKQLSKVFTRLDKKGAFLMLSNSDPKNNNPDDNYFDQLYQPFHIARIKARRAINSKASGRGRIYEIVVTNY